MNKNELIEAIGVGVDPLSWTIMSLIPKRY